MSDPLTEAVPKPLIAVLNGSANWLLRRVGVEPREELSGSRSASELAALVRRSAEQGTLDESTATLLTNSLDFGALTAVDVMTDRLRLVTVRRDDTAADVLRTARATGHSRFPVIGESSDDIVGVVPLRRAVAVPYERRDEVPAAALMVDVPRVPDGLKVFDGMVAFGRKLANETGGILVDDNLRPLTDTGIEKIRNQLMHIYERMEARGVPSGSRRSLRLFS